MGHIKPDGRPGRCLLTPVMTSCVMASRAPCPVSPIPLPSLPWAGGWPGSVSTLMYCSGSPFSDKVCVFLFSGSTLALFLLSCICVIFQSRGLVSSIGFLFELQILYMEICQHPLGNSVLVQTGQRKLAARAVPDHCRAAGRDDSKLGPPREGCRLPHHSSLWCVWPRGPTQSLACLPALSPVGMPAPACLSKLLGSWPQRCPRNCQAPDGGWL